MFLEACIQILEERGNFVFSVSWSFEDGIRNRDRHWKARREIFLLTVTKGAYEHVQSGDFLCKYFLGSILNKTDAHLESGLRDVVHQGRTP